MNSVNEKSLNQKTIAPKQNLLIDAYTTPCPFCVKEEDSIGKAMFLMDSEGVRHIPVVGKDEKLIGLITQRDLIAIHSLDLNPNLIVKDAMIKEPESVLVLEENGKINGIFTNTDALNALIEVLRGEIL